MLQQYNICNQDCGGFSSQPWHPGKTSVKACWQMPISPPNKLLTWKYFKVHVYFDLMDS